MLLFIDLFMQFYRLEGEYPGRLQVVETICLERICEEEVTLFSAGYEIELM